MYGRLGSGQGRNGGPHTDPGILRIMPTVEPELDGACSSLGEERCRAVEVEESELCLGSFWSVPASSPLSSTLTRTG